MSIEPQALRAGEEAQLRKGPVPASGRPADQPSGPPLPAAFERAYRSNVDSVIRYFARRCRDPQTVADLTSETFVRAAAGFAGFDPRRGSHRAWLFGIAGHVFAHHCAQVAAGNQAVARLGGHRPLDRDEIEELAERIDAEAQGAALLRRWDGLSPPERTAIELVDLEGLSPKEAAAALGVSRVIFRKRLSRARARLSKEPPTPDDENGADQ